MEKNELAKKLAKIIYICLVKPYRMLRGSITLSIYTARFRAAKREAVRQTTATGKAHYVVFSNGRFYVYNKDGMLALAKAYRKRTGLSAEWRKLYVFETHVMTDAEKAELERKKQEEK